MRSNNPQSDSPKRSIFSIGLVFSALILGILFYTGYLQKGFNKAKNLLDIDNNNSQVTYYQWTDASGTMIISRNKPANNMAFISFQGSEDLVKNENNVDSDLIAKSKNIQPSLSKTSSERKSNKSKGNLTGSSIGPFKAMQKAKNCTNLSMQMGAAKGDKKKKQELAARHAKEC